MISALIDFLAVLAITLCTLIAIGMYWRGMTYRGNDSTVHSLVAIAIVAALLITN